MTSPGTTTFVQRITARVFAVAASAAASGKSAPGGGNPVTVFHSPHHALSSSVQSALAQDCEWESVMISPNHTFHFYMPSGEQVPFCAHAAMGAARAIAETKDQNELNEQQQQLLQPWEVPYKTITTPHNMAFVDHKTNNVGLSMTSTYHETLVDATQLVHACGINIDSVLPGYKTNFSIQASVARPKTMVPISTLEKLHQISPPFNADAVRMACDDIESTGLYLYAESLPSSSSSGIHWECRQFPRASGYPEDPATGIAAAALAVHLHPTRQWKEYHFYQGTAMGRPSWIQIRKIELLPDNQVQLECWGRVDIDNRDELEVPI